MASPRISCSRRRRRAARRAKDDAFVIRVWQALAGTELP
jgi:hypothetical protein